MGRRQQEAIEQITRAGRHVLGLVDEVLTLSRLESGAATPRLEPVPLAETVAEALGILGPLAGEQEVTLFDDVSAAGERYVWADHQQLRQVVLNLASNAIKYNRPQGEVHVRCQRADEGRVRLVVEDTGIGITEEDLARLFVPFVRLKSAPSAVEGTGLGLALSHRLVSAMKGKIGVGSEPGRGSTFWVELAAADPPPRGRPADPAEKGLTASASAAASAARRREVVLCVEDNMANVRLIQRLLGRRSDVALLVATDGTTALDLARKHRPTLVLLDLHLPDMGGEEVLAALRRDPATAAARVVVVSADHPEDQEERLRASGGADGYLPKPYDVSRLLAMVDGVEDPPEPADPGVPPVETTSPSPLARGVIAQLRALAGRGRDETTFRRLVVTFVEGAETQLDDIRSAVTATDPEQIYRCAHRLAGSSASFGAYRMAGVCRRLEAVTKEGDLGTVPELVYELERALCEAEEAFDEELSGIERGGQQALERLASTGGEGPGGMR